MTKYLVLYKGDVGAREQMANASAEDQAKGMQAWMDWANAAGSAIVDLGAPLAAASAGADETVGGFSILQADSAEELQKVLAGHPHPATGGTIECHEFLPVPGM